MQPSRLTPESRQLRRVALSGLLGTAVEFYDFGAGFSPLIASSLLASNGGGSMPVSLLLCGGAAITALTVWRIRETHTDALEPTTTRSATPAPEGTPR